MECTGGKLISVLSASYGRQSSTVCGNGGNFATLECNAANSLDVVRGTCDGLQTCDIAASNDVFGDPCVETNKYLEITYKCEGKTHIVILSSLLLSFFLLLNFHPKVPVEEI